MERLQKVMAHAGIASRRKAEQLILEGRVKVNGETVRELGRKVSPEDFIEVDGKPIREEKKVYILLNKPVGYISTVDDPRGRRTVLDLVADVKERVYPVGRLDYDTSGLLILTNDGELTYKLTHPSFEVKKTYLVEVEGKPGKELARLEKGVMLSDGMTAPAAVAEVKTGKNSTSFLLTIHEGRNRQVRRMCEAIGYPVKSLKRIKFAFLELGDLPEGRYRYLTEKEIKMLQSLT
ncbi:MAG: pseudouridine synthase [Halanaerobiales bacterium]|jgi:pseudouridine synthase